MRSTPPISTVVSVQPGSPLLTPPDPVVPDSEDAASPPGVAQLPEHRIFGGVCAVLAERFGMDVVWIRLGFVVLTLFGGFGIIAYAGLWLALVAGPTSGKRWVGVLGAVVVALGMLWALQTGAFNVWTGEFAIVALLVGVAIVLWQPRWKAESPSVTTLPPPSMPSAPPTPPLVSSRPEPWAPAYKRPRQHSLLGRTTLGIALIVAAGGALIDSTTGHRLHPEQWLGAAALVCACGLAVGAFAGRARWLIVPAALFAASGLVAGEFARLGVSAGDAFEEGHGLYISANGGVSGYQSIESGFGDLWVTIDGNIPEAGARVRARSVFGDIVVGVADSVPVEVHVRSDHGTVRIDGVNRPDGTYNLGPAGTPAVIVNARSGWGDVEVMTQQYDTAPIDTVAPAVDDLGTLTPVAEYVSATSDGWFVLVNGEAVIDDHNEVVVGDAYPPDQYTDDSSSDGSVSVPGDATSSSLTIPTSVGDFRLLPRGLLVTPSQSVLDLVALRQKLTTTGKAEQAIPPATPIVTVPPVPPQNPAQTLPTTSPTGPQP